MKLLGWKTLIIALLGLLPLVVGCHKPSPPPAPLTADELPAALEKAFSKAPADTRELVNEVVAAVQSQDYSRAFHAVQALASRPGLTREQANVTSRALLTVNGLLQEAQTKGDLKAAQTLKTYRSDK